MDHLLHSLDPKLFYYATKHVAVSPADGRRGQSADPLLRSHGDSPALCPDGKSVYFIADDDGTQNLAQVNITDGKITRPDRWPVHAWTATPCPRTAPSPPRISTRTGLTNCSPLPAANSPGSLT